MMMGIQPHSPRVSRLRVSDVLEVSKQVSYSVLRDEPAMMAAMYMVALETEGVAVLDTEGELHGVLTGYNLLSLISSNPQSAWASLYKTHCYEVDWQLLNVTPADPLGALLGAMYKRRWGYAAVHRGGSSYSVIGVLDVARLLAGSGRLEEIEGVRLSDIATPPIVSVSVGASIQVAMRSMLRRGVRRIYVEEEGKIITDRDIVRYLLSSPTVNEFRDDPRGVLERPISAMRSHMRRPAELEPDTALREAVESLLSSEAYTVVTSDRRLIATPWDVTAKLYGRYPSLMDGRVL